MGATLGIAGLATLILACCVWQSTERPRITSNHWFSNSTLLNPSGVTYLRFSPCARPGAVPGEGENKSVPAILRTFQFSVGGLHPKFEDNELDNELLNLVKGDEKDKTRGLAIKKRVSFSAPPDTGADSDASDTPLHDVVRSRRSSSQPPQSSQLKQPPAPRPSTPEPEEAPEYQRNSHKIREIDDRIVWHEATNCIPRGPPHPSKLDKAVAGDLFIIRQSPKVKVKSWLLAEDGKWKPVGSGYQRPDGRVLSFSPSKRDPMYVKEEWYKHGNS